ncbi:hypothetical protein CJF32_00005413 [Rutstroemia sp. NJR-2017a WRK4]|nr:hypothetical protein CJF32_00005413 [Rutstroemia sp. NJR-2017a WRK4]
MPKLSKFCLALPRLSNCGPTPPKDEVESPPQIRCMIWNYARSRGITIDLGPVPDGHAVTSRSPCPVTCHINRGSRAETMRHYEKFEHFFIDCKPKYGSGHYYLFFNPAVDSVVISSSQEEYVHQEPFPSYNRVAELEQVPCRQYFKTQRGVEGGFQIPQYLQIQSLHIPARAWSWGMVTIQVFSPHDITNILQLSNLKEIVFEGGQAGLKTEYDIRKCRERIERDYELVREEYPFARDIGLNTIQTPRIDIIMPWHHSYDLLFYGTTTESMTKRKSRQV